MTTSDDELKKRYNTLSDSELVYLQRTGGLTAEATTELNEQLAIRGLTREKIDDIIAEESKEQRRACLTSLPEPIPKIWTHTAIIGYIICLVCAYTYRSVGIYVVLCYTILLFLLSFWWNTRGKKRALRPDYPELAGRPLTKDLVRTELSKFESENIEYILMEGKSPDIHWLQIGKEKHGYLLNLSPSLITYNTQLPANDHKKKFKDLCKIGGNRVLRLVSSNIETSAAAIYSLISGLRGLEKVYSITYE